MISRAINILRSLRSSDFYDDEEKGSSDISVNETSSESSFIKDNSAVCSELDATNNSRPLQHGFNSIKPRASIRMKTMDSSNINQRSTEKSTSYNTNRTEMDDDSVVILDQFPAKSKDTINKNSLQNIEKNSENELICLDSEELAPLVIDLDERLSAEDQSSSSDSQCSYHTSPQEVFDLCSPEPRVNKLKSAEINKNSCNEFERSIQTTGRKKVTVRKPLEAAIPSQSLLQDHSADVLCRSSTQANMNLHSDINVKENVKNVEDEIFRLRLPIRKHKRKKLFTVKISQLIALVSNKYHPLHKWKDLITLANIGELSENDKKKMAEILANFLEVKVIQIKS